LFSLWEVMKWNSNLHNPKHLSGDEQHLTHSIFFWRIQSAWTYCGPTSYPLFYLGTSLLLVGGIANSYLLLV
jgi:hypothetical protein